MDKKILIIEDNKPDFNLIQAYLSDYISLEGIRHSSTLAGGIKSLSEDPPEVIILDLNLPDSFGLETLRKLNTYGSDIPVVVLTGNNDIDLGKTALSYGASDYLSKNHITEESLWKSLIYAIERKKNDRVREELSQRNNKRFLANQMLSKFIKLVVKNTKLSELTKAVAGDISRVLEIEEMRICFEDEKICSNDCRLNGQSSGKNCVLEGIGRSGLEYLLSGNSIIIDNINEVSSTFGILKGSYLPSGLNSAMIIPMMVENKYIGAIICGSRKLRKWWTEEEAFLVSIADILAIARENEIHSSEEEKLNLKIKKSDEDLVELSKMHYELLEVRNVLLDAIPDMAWMKDCNGRYKAVNKIFASMCNMPKEEIMNKTDLEIWEPEFARAFMANDLKVLKSGEELGVEEFIMDKNGNKRLYETIKVPIFNKEGQVAGTVGMSHDITLLKQASEVLEHENRKLEEIVSGRTKDLKTVEKNLQKEMQERILVEDQLKKLSVAVEQSPVSIVITDLDGNIEYVNPTFCVTTGYLMKEAIGQNPRILKSGKTPAETYRQLWDRLNEGSTWTGELLNKKKNNELYWEYCVISPIKNTSGIITNYIAIKEDITESKNAEKVLKESEERFKLLYDKAPVGYLSLDIVGNIIDVNYTWLQKLGYLEDEVKGKWMGHFLTGDMKKNFTSSYRNFILKGMPKDREFDILAKDGKIITVQFSGKVAYDDTGNFIQTHCVFFDVTERRKMEKTIAESEERFRTIFENSPVGIRISVNGVTQITNRSFMKIFGYSNPEEPKGGSVLDGVAPGDRAKVMNYLLKKVKGDQTEESFTYCGMRKDGSVFPVSASVAELLLPEGRAIVGFFADITDQKQKENQIISSLKEKEVLLKEIHHRVKNNLQIISSLLNLQTNNITDPRLMEAFNVSRSRVKAMALIHERLYQSKDLSIVNFKEYISELVMYLQRTYTTDGKRITFNIAIDSIDLPIDTAIPCGLIVNELISNALKYAFHDVDSGVLTVSVKQNGDSSACLEIADNGRGLPRGFEISKTNTLGLQLVHNLVDQIDGSLEISNKDGVKFKIKFKL
ncbi:MAG: PAS domain S-box protein [Ignavibacteria bacterium]|nr:PAS domain S-box protein [Ignavibacteria bacterium]MCU7504157.1 PAS domain S-box protein [Ignavibacteria bacterium]MCU7516393.1 PAS domain S-box protein [Ignavibacteria bacterium]